MSTSQNPSGESRTSWMSDWRRQQARRAEENRNEWFNVERHSSFPDLEFETPQCPMCREHTRYDDQWFFCDDCEVMWPQNGYGTQAERTTETPRFMLATAGEGE